MQPFKKIEGLKIVVNKIKSIIRTKEFFANDAKEMLAYLRKLIPMLRDLIKTEKLGTEKFLKALGPILAAADIVKSNNPSVQLRIAEDSIGKDFVPNKVGYESLEELLQYCESVRDWFNFLNRISITTDFKFDETITKKNVGHFLKSVENLNLNGIEAVKNMKFDERKFRVLNKVVPRAEKQKYHITPDGVLVFNAPLIMITEVLKALPNNTFVKQIELGALEKIVVDTNMNLPGTQISMIAPTIEVLNQATINITGLNATKHKQKKAASLFRKGSGEDGLPGYTGGRGGDFLMIALKITGLLSVWSDGGSGSPGQDGGNAIDVDQPLFKSDMFLCNDIKSILRKKNIKFEAIHGENYTFYTKGANGGDGGKSGKGGKAGRVDIMSIPSKPNVNVRVYPGVDAPPSSGGLAGFMKSQAYLERINVTKCIWKNMSKAISGMPGRPNYVLTPPEVPPKLVFLKPRFAIVDSYKRYWKSSSLPTSEFYDFIEKHSLILDFYVAAEFIQEVLRLESKYFEIENEVYFKSEYHSVLESMEGYLQREKNLQKDDANILSFLNGLVLRKLTYMRFIKESRAIINVKLYLKLALKYVEDIHSYGNFTITNQIKDEIEEKKSNIVTKERADHLDMFDRDIVQLNKMIDKKQVELIKEYNLREHLRDDLPFLREMKEFIIYDIVSLKVERAKRIIKKILAVIAVILRVIAVILLFIPPIGTLISGILMAAASALEAIASGLGNIALDYLRPHILKMDKFNKTNIYRSQVFLTDSYLLKKQCPYSAVKNLTKTVEIRRAIEIGDAKLEFVEDYQKCHKYYASMLRTVFDQFKYVSFRLQNMSLVTMDVTKFKLEKLLNNVSLYLRQYFIGFPGIIPDRVESTLNQYIQVFRTILKMVGRKHMLVNQQNMTDYIAFVNLMKARTIRRPDQKKYDDMRLLRKIVSSKVVVSLYRKAVSAFQVYVFPFAHFYLDDLYLPEHFSGDALTTATIARIQNLLQKMHDFDNSVTKKFDDFLYDMSFSSKYSYSKPFYTFTQKQYVSNIRMLFGGKEMQMWLPLEESYKQNIIKFRTIRVRINAKDPTVQLELDRLLAHFYVEMRHNGTNEYRCDEKVYDIPSEPLIFSHSFQYRNNGIPVMTNVIYNKLKLQSPKLSPYSFWFVKMVAKKPFTNAHLGRFVEHVDVEFEGEGQYVSKKFTCNGTYMHYYKRFLLKKTIKKSNIIKPKSTPEKIKFDFQKSSGQSIYRKSCIRTFFEYAKDLIKPLMMNVHFELPNWKDIKMKLIVSSKLHRRSTNFYDERYNVPPIWEQRLNAGEFYDRIDCTLALGPVYLHLWKKHFRRTRKCNKY